MSTLKSNDCDPQFVYCFLIITLYNLASLLHIIAWAQEWSAEEVYDTAFEQVFPASQVKDAKQDFGDWYDSCESPSLPIVVRTELIRAFRIHEANGRMDVLRLGAWAQHQCKRIMWIGFGILFLILVF